MQRFFFIFTTPSNSDVIFVFSGVNFVDSIVIHLNSDLEFLTYSTKYIWGKTFRGCGERFQTKKMGWKLAWDLKVDPYMHGIAAFFEKII